MLLVVFLTVLNALSVQSQDATGNRPPYFSETLQDILVTQGIYENTTVGTVLGAIKCIDPDGDKIAYFVDRTVVLRIPDQSSGVVVLSKQLDREQNVFSDNPNEKAFSVNFLCTDINDRGRPISPGFTSIEYTINVRDNNDEAPTFSVDLKGGFTFEINESDPIGTRLKGNIKVVDKDLALNAKLSFLDFFCLPVDPEPCQLFEIDYREVGEGEYDANIVLKGKLDFETREDYRVELRAVDGLGSSEKKNTASTGIRIVVKDNQDTDPLFTNQIYNFDVSEGLGVGADVNFKLSARDGDSGAQRRIRFEILDHPDGHNLFNVGTAELDRNSIFNTGNYKAPLSVRTEIDREDAAVANGYTFKAKAIEIDEAGQDTTATATAEFTVNILDINDNSPRFSLNSYNISLPEMAERAGGVQIPNLRIEVNDPDEPSNAQYRLEIVSQTFSGVFALTPDSQVSGSQFFYLIVNSYQSLDYDDPRNRLQTVELKAVEQINGQPGTRSSFATVTVHLEDVNDNLPIFSQDAYEGSVNENAPNNTSILQVTASDKDSGRNGEFTFTLQNSIRSIFSVNPTTGVISVIGPLDYETQSDYSFLVFATDRGITPKTSQVPVRVRITDYNDVGPIFTLPIYTGRVTETNLTFESPVIVEARDEVDPDARITYRIVSGNTADNSFVLNRLNGTLTLQSLLNYENTPNKTGIYSLVVEASDNGVPPEVAQSRITITVIDENNHGPIFSPTLYSKTLSEAAEPGSFVVQVYATDADFGSNGDITYRIGSGRGRDNFVVTKNGTVLVSNSPSFDYDVLKSISLTIIAIDGGSPQKSASASLSVTVTDANNKPPVFEVPLYNAVVNETSPVGTFVKQVSATDPDSTHKIRYSIRESSIIAIESSGVQVGSIFNYDYTKSFTINPESGIISVGSKLDRNFVVEMSFAVVATDVGPQAIGVQTATSQVTINIRGSPNRELYFNPPWSKSDPVYEVPTLESTPVGSEILTLQARDPSDFDSVLTNYEEVPGSDTTNYFKITSVSKPTGMTPGIVVLNRALDFESGDLIHSVEVRAVKEDIINGFRDRRTVSATIVVQVQDFNDNEPEFSQSVYEFQVPENAVVDYIVNTIVAYDRDSASFGPIEFSFGGGIDSENFKLYQPTEDGSAQVLVAMPLDFERRNFYEIDVIASDNKYRRGSAIQNRAKAVIRIQVVDVNDNYPTFGDLSRSFSVPETAPIETVLGVIVATDADFGLNGQVTYSLKPDNTSTSSAAALDMFGVSPEQGVLFTKRSLRGASGTYKMYLFAEDAGGNPKISSIPVTVNVQGAQDDDGTPQWLYPINNIIVYHPENKLGVLNLGIKAMARTEDSSVRYNLVAYGDYRSFDIDPVSGNISVTELLDREAQPSYTLVVQANDVKNVTRFSRRTIIVELIDEDDNDPSFLRTSYSACPTDFELPTMFSTIDNTAKGVIVARAKACDPDAEPNNRAYYYKYTGNNFCRGLGNSLNVLLNGSIESNEMLDYDVSPVYKVCVQVFPQPQDAAGRKKRQAEEEVVGLNKTKDVALIYVNMIDINDQRPIFTNVPYLSVVETSPSEPDVANIYAVDRDGPEYNRVRYEISDTKFYPHDGSRPYPLKGAFSVDSNTGAIMTNLPTYDDFQNGYFELTIDAFDFMNNAYNDTVKIIVVVYHRSQVLRVVMNKVPSQGQTLAENLVSELHGAGQPDVSFIFKAASEHRTKDGVVSSRTDCCFVAVKNKRVFETGTGLDLLEQAKYSTILDKKEYEVVQKGTCYPVRSSREAVKWRDLWWVLVVIAIFIFICCIILIATVCILYNRYKDYMTTEKTYLVAQ